MELALWLALYAGCVRDLPVVERRPWRLPGTVSVRTAEDVLLLLRACESRMWLGAEGLGAFSFARLLTASLTFLPLEISPRVYGLAELPPYVVRAFTVTRGLP